MKKIKVLALLMLLILTACSGENEPYTEYTADCQYFSGFVLQEAERILGVSFSVSSREQNFAMPDGRSFRWCRLDLQEDLDLSSFPQTEVGNIFATQLGDVFILVLADNNFALYVDVGCGSDVGWSAQHRQYSVFPLRDYAAMDFAADALFFVDTMEDSHAIFGFPDMISADYETVRDEFLANAARAQDIREFNLAMLRYIRELQDGHLTLDGMWWVSHLYLDAATFVTQDGMFILGSDEQVIAVGGVAVSEIIGIVEEHFFFANEVMRNRVVNDMARNKDFLSLAGVDVEGDVTLVLSEGEIYVNFVSRAALPNRIFGGEPVDYVIRYEIKDGDIFYIRLTTFWHDQPAHDQTVEAIRAAVNAGTRDFIVDIRDNGGGNDAVGWELLDAMGLIPPRIGTYRRISPIVREISPERVGVFPQARDGDIIQQSPPSHLTASNPRDVNVVVLTNNNSFSSAINMTVWVQDGGGLVIGEPPLDAPTVFGDMLNFTLPSSGLARRVSWSRFVRPDVNANQDMVVPDILVPSDQALEAALKHLRGEANG